MLRTLKQILRINSQASCRCASKLSFLDFSHLRSAFCDLRVQQNNYFHAYLPRMKDETGLMKRRDKLATRKDESTALEGEIMRSFDMSFKSEQFPTLDLPERMFNGIMFKHIPILYVYASKNNTILSLTDKGIKMSTSCGKEGFKHTKKGTNIAAQTAGISLGRVAIKKGYHTLRVMIRGLGPGRLSAVKGLQLAGVNIVSVSDRTPDFTTVRPKKQRRI